MGERLPLPGVLRGPAVWGRAFCGRCGAPTAFEVFEVFGCDECRDKDFFFDGTQAHLRYEGVGEELVHALKYKGYLRLVERVMAPLMSDTHGAAGSTRWCRCRYTACGSPSAGSTRRSL